MPPQRNRGSYAKYICLNCRTRKIKCTLPDNVEIRPNGQAQPEELSCQRCRSKGLSCVVDHTTLGRPSQNPGVSSRPKMKASPQSRISSSSEVPQTDEGPDGVDEYLIVKPRKAGTPGPTTPKHVPPRMDKFLAMLSPTYLLSTLLLRDKGFASNLPRRYIKPRASLEEVLHIGLIESLERQLSWHRLYYPDIPKLACLFQEVAQKSQHDLDYVPTSLLLAFLCTLALDVEVHSGSRFDDLRITLNDLVHQFGQQLLFTLPWHRYAVLSLELIAEFRPLALATDQTTAAYSVRGRMMPPLAKELAVNLRLPKAKDTIAASLGDDSSSLDKQLYLDCLQWYRLVLMDAEAAHAGNGRQHEEHRLSGESSTDIVAFLQTLLQSGRVPAGMLYAYHSILCMARQLHNIIRVQTGWKDLVVLESTILEHKNACEQQKEQLKETLQETTSGRPDDASVTLHLIDMQLHASYVWVSGAALFFCVMASGMLKKMTQPSMSQSNPIDAEQALQISDKIIDIFAEPTRDQHAGELYTSLLVKYGDRRMDDQELVLANFISAADTLHLGGIPFVGPTRATVCGILFHCKDIMEGNAARMKGWGGLHERAHMQLLLMRNVAASLERLGVTSHVGMSDAVKQGCLWASTARILRSLHDMLAEWKEWSTLGKAASHRGVPDTSVAKMTTPADPLTDVDMLEDLLPDDLFFDWNLWLQDDMSWDFV